MDGPAHVQLSKVNWRLKVFWKPDSMYLIGWFLKHFTRLYMSRPSILVPSLKSPKKFGNFFNLSNRLLLNKTGGFLRHV